MTHSEDRGIIAQLEGLNLQTQNNTTAISQLAEIVKYQVIQAESDRQQAAQDRLNFQNAITEINNCAEADREHHTKYRQ